MPNLSRYLTIVSKCARCRVSRRKSEESIERIFLTFSETQEFLGVSHQTVYKLMKEGLPSHKIGKKRVFLKEDLISWIKDH
ncbi:DNA-binding protein [Candidatus Aerophobetes bacterium]|uniref:DNA-binding protein n=1 Tax=Aerophobetes bacterium TaxID=2030807 RepID=A0A523S578_UNCAE|nr:MAG: DNA-binding protein [Candidatus Aerophobetes bacterium]